LLKKHSAEGIAQSVEKGEGIGRNIALNFTAITLKLGIDKEGDDGQIQIPGFENLAIGN